MRLFSALLVFAAVLDAQPPEGQPVLTSDCAVDGFVVNAVTGEPLARARVMLMGPRGQNGVSADNAGRFRFTDIPCGQTQIMVMKPGFLQGGYGVPRPGGLFLPLILASGEAAHDLKISLTPQAVVTGKVLDEQGDPMMGVQITALAARVVEGRRSFQPGAATSTNDLGEYRLAGLQPGKYIICAYPNNSLNGFDPGEKNTVPGVRCYPGPPEGGAASALDVRGTDNRADFTISRVPAVRIRGNLLGAVRGAGVSLAKRGANGMNRTLPGNVSPDGSFEIHGVLPGSYLLTTDFWESGKRLVARLPLEVGTSDIDGVTVRLEPGFTVTGQVRFDLKKGQPGPGAPGLSLRSSDPLTGGGQLTWDKTRASFSVNELTPGNYRLEVFPNGHYYLKSATLAGRDISKEEIPITQAAGPIDVVLADDGGSIEGQVEDAAGKPISGWVMVLQAGRAPRNVMSRADGHFKVSNLPPGDYQVYAWDDVQPVEYANPDWMMRNAKGAAASVEAGQTAQVKLQQQPAPPL